VILPIEFEVRWARLDLPRLPSSIHLFVFSEAQFWKLLLSQAIAANRMHVRYWHMADINPHTEDVCFDSVSGHSQIAR